MKRWLKKIRTRWSQREQRALEHWEEQRKQGKRRFVLHTAFTYLALVMLVIDVSDYLYDGSQMAVAAYSIKSVGFFLTGLLIAHNSWATMEDKYARLTSRTVSANVGPLPTHRSLRGNG